MRSAISISNETWNTFETHFHTLLSKCIYFYLKLLTSIYEIIQFWPKIFGYDCEWNLHFTLFEESFYESFRVIIKSSFITKLMFQVDNFFWNVLFLQWLTTPDMIYNQTSSKNRQNSTKPTQTFCSQTVLVQHLKSRLLVFMYLWFEFIHKNFQLENKCLILEMILWLLYIWKQELLFRFQPLYVENTHVSYTHKRILSISAS